MSVFRAPLIHILYRDSSKSSMIVGKRDFSPNIFRRMTDNNDNNKKNERKFPFAIENHFPMEILEEIGFLVGH